MSLQVSNRIKEVKEYYFSTKLRQIRQMQDNGKQIINLGIGNPDLQTNDEVIEVLRKSVKITASNAYQPYSGIPMFIYLTLKNPGLQVGVRFIISIIIISPVNVEVSKRNNKNCLSCFS